MTDKEYIRRYADAADRELRDCVAREPHLRARYTDEFIRKLKRAARVIAERNVPNMPPGPGRAWAMRESIRRVANGGGWLHVRLESKRPAGSAA